MGNYNRKGEYEYSDGRKEIGQWVEGKKQGEFEWYDYKKRLTHIKVYENDKEIKSKEVKEKIYYERKERNLWVDKDQIIPVKNQIVPVKDQDVTVKNQTMTVKDQTMTVKDQTVRDKDHIIKVNKNSGCCLIF